MAWGGINDNTGPSYAPELVNEAWDYYRTLGNRWVEQAQYAVNNLDSIYVEPIQFSVDYDLTDWLPTFQRPELPADPAFVTVVPKTVADPDLEAVTMRDIGDAPAEPDFSSLAQYAPPAPPNVAMPSAPANVDPVLETIVIADRPDFAIPELPTLYDLQLPEVPAIVLPEFDGVRPSTDIEMPEDGEFTFVEVPHDTTLQNALKAQINHMMQGGTGLPLAVEQAIFDRGRAREDAMMRKAVQEASEEFAARGLSEPTGLFGRRMREVRADARTKTAELNRDLTIKVAEIGVENVRFAVAQGMALEQTLIQQNLAINDRALKLATYLRDYALQRLNARIAILNIQQQAYATDAQVWRQRIEGMLAQLEVYKAQIEGQRLVGEINKQLVERYEAGIRAVGELAQLYKTDVEAAKVRGEINLQRIEAAKLTLQRFDTEVRAWSAVQDGYRTQVEAALGTTRFAEVMANIYSARIQAYKTKGDSYFREGEFKLQRNAQQLDVFRGRLSGAEQDLRGQIAQLDGQVRAFSARIERYAAEGTILQAESAALDRTASLKIEQEKSRVGVVLQQAQMRIEQAMKIGEILVEQIKAKAAALSQLAAASQSGVNFGASMSYGMSESFGRSKGVSWNGEAPDYSGLDF